MDYNTALEFIYGSTDFETIPPVSMDRTNYNLERFGSLVSRLHNPHMDYPVIHIAGSKGKGSTAHYIAGILHQAGYDTGLYLSPHLCSPRERIRINGLSLTQTEFASAANEIFQLYRNKHRDDYRTVFELLTAMAFVAFRTAKADIAVVETGMGGRLDATNIIVPILSIITPIVLEHTTLLGNTLDQIAAEKAGIIKPGVVLLTTEQEPKALSVLHQQAQSVNAPVHGVRELVSLTQRRPLMCGEEMTVRISSPFSCNLQVLLPNWGLPQVQAASTAIAAVCILANQGFKISIDHIKMGLYGTRVPGRIELVAEEPLIIIDVAHHPLAINGLLAALEDRNLSHFHLVFGANNDKNWQEMLDSLVPHALSINLCASRNPRAVTTGVMKAYLEGRQKESSEHDSVAQALKTARSMASVEEAVVVTGSFYIAGEAFAELGIDG